jgi:hypothetical protein
MQRSPPSAISFSLQSKRSTTNYLFEDRSDLDVGLGPVESANDQNPAMIGFTR